MFRTLDDTIMVAPQIGIDAVAEAKALGVRLIINNRPEGESDDQVPGDAIEAAARAEGLDYVAIPVSHSGFSEPQVAAMRAALDGATGPVLAYCRSGTRSTLLWALAQSAKGDHPAALAEKAARAGYDLAPVATLMDMLRSKA
ncbi:MAG: TIGR01244 family sulfur transferase [Sphingomonadaceae bacterium]|jgi:uncharacterized protein (TIGR01244 family)